MKKLDPMPYTPDLNVLVEKINEIIEELGRLSASCVATPDSSASTRRPRGRPKKR